MSVTEISYLLLWCLVFLEAFILRATMREAVALGKLCEEVLRRRRLALERSRVAAPSFVARILDADTFVVTKDLKGDPTILLFLSTDAVDDSKYQSLDASLHGLWHKARGRLYIVCRGDDAACRRLIPAHTFGQDWATVPILLDPDGTIARRFIITDTPAAIQLDAQARIERRGLQVTPHADGAKDAVTHATRQRV